MTSATLLNVDLKRDPNVWDGEMVAPGERREFRVTVSKSYVGTDVRIPVVVTRGLHPGPSVFVTAAVHGDELNGTGAVHQLLSDPSFELVAGTLISVPVVNLLGFERHSRYLPDRRDLNRCFPGSPRGSLASRMARVVFDEIVGRCHFGIDLHTAALHRTNFPNVRADLKIPGLEGLARAFGAELIVQSTGPSGSLRRAASQNQCPTLILEAGEVWKVEPSALTYARRGIRNVLTYLGMVLGTPEPPPFQLVLNKTRWVRARNGGFLRFHVGPGEVVTKGQPLADNTTLTGEVLQQVKAPKSGIILGMTTLPSVAPGDPICHLATPEGDFEAMAASWQRLAPQSLFQRTREDLARNLTLSPAEQPLRRARGAKPPRQGL